MQKRQLKDELEKQMQETQLNKNKARFLTTKESQLNHEVFSSGYSALPGISKDHSIKKQQFILENFLKVPQKSAQF